MFRRAAGSVYAYDADYAAAHINVSAHAVYAANGLWRSKYDIRTNHGYKKQNRDYKYRCKSFGYILV
jgi:hypothetical protein